MLRAALASAGAHEAALRNAIPPLLHPQGDEIVDAHRSHRRDDLGGVPTGRHARIRNRLWP